MKIAFITDYPLRIESKTDFSGAEVSMTVLSEKLQREGVEINFVCPTKSSHLATRSTTNPLWYLYSAWFIKRELSNLKADVIHVHSKNVLLGTVLANLLIQKPLVVTVRDYRAICDLGMCLLRGKKICSLKEYLLGDIPYFVSHYKSGSAWDYICAYLIGLYQLLLRPIHILALKKVDKVVCLSRAQEAIYNGVSINNTIVIYNPVTFSLVEKKKKQIFFGGRYTPGKGKEILDVVLPRFIKDYPEWEVVRVGKNSPNGQVSYSEYLRMVGESAMALVPSVWPEPFGRAALDALSVGTPVITTNMGGLPEIVENNKYGLVVDPNSEDFWRALQTGMKKYKLWVKEIIKDEGELNDKFTVKPIQDYIDLYKRVINQ